MEKLSDLLFSQQAGGPSRDITLFLEEHGKLPIYWLSWGGYFSFLRPVVRAPRKDPQLLVASYGAFITRPRLLELIEILSRQLYRERELAEFRARGELLRSALSPEVRESLPGLFSLPFELVPSPRCGGDHPQTGMCSRCRPRWLNLLSPSSRTEGGVHRIHLQRLGPRRP